MKKFLKIFIIFMLPIVLLFAYVELRLQYYPSAFQKKSTYLRSHKSEIEVVVLGSSHNQDGINPRYFEKFSCANIAYSGQDLNMDHMLLNKYITDLPKLKFVLLELDYHSLEILNPTEYERNIYTTVFMELIISTEIFQYPITRFLLQTQHYICLI